MRNPVGELLYKLWDLSTEILHVSLYIAHLFLRVCDILIMVISNFLSDSSNICVISEYGLLIALLIGSMSFFTYCVIFSCVTQWWVKASYFYSCKWTYISSHSPSVWALSQYHQVTSWVEGLLCPTALKICYQYLVFRICSVSRGFFSMSAPSSTLEHSVMKHPQGRSFASCSYNFPSKLSLLLVDTF